MNLLNVDAARGMASSDQWVPRDIQSVFSFFSDAHNLERLTPGFLCFKVLSISTPTIQESTEICYKLKLHGVPIRWTSRITDWHPTVSFSDIQIYGPYRYWCHRHLFESENGGTWIRDRVDYQVPMGFLGRRLAGNFVAQDVKRIFAYRQQVIRDLFGAEASQNRPPKDG